MLTLNWQLVGKQGLSATMGNDLVNDAFETGSTGDVLNFSALSVTGTSDLVFQALTTSTLQLPVFLTTLPIAQGVT